MTDLVAQVDSTPTSNDSTSITRTNTNLSSIPTTNKTSGLSKNQKIGLGVSILSLACITLTVGLAVPLSRNAATTSKAGTTGSTVTTTSASTTTQTTTTSLTTTTASTTTSTTSTSSTTTSATSTTTSTTTTSVTTTTTTTTSTTTTTTSVTTTTTSTTSTTTTTITTTTTSVTTSTTTSTTTTTSATTTTTTVTTTTTTALTCLNVAWNTTGVTVAGNGTAGSAANQLSSPWSIYIDSQRNLYIADSGNHRIQYWPASSTSGSTIAGVSSLSGNNATLLNTPSDVTLDSYGNMYVADRGNNRIQFFRNRSSTGITLSSSWGSTGGFRSVQITSSGIIYASDTTNHALWRNSSIALGYNGAGANSNQLNGNQGIAVDTTINVGYVYIANTNQHTVVQWIPSSSTGTVVAGTNGVSGSSNTTLRAPVSVKLDSWANLYVVDNNNHRIQLYCRYPTVTTTARTIVGTGALGSTSTTLNYPTGLALDDDLNLYVADTSNHRIQRFSRLP